MARAQLTLDQIDRMSKAEIEEHTRARLQELEVERRRQSEKAERDAIERQFLAEGGDAAAFDKEWPKIKQERAAAHVRRIDQDARSAAFRRTSETL